MKQKEPKYWVLNFRLLTCPNCRSSFDVKNDMYDSFPTHYRYCPYCGIRLHIKGVDG